MGNFIFAKIDLKRDRETEISFGYEGVLKPGLRSETLTFNVVYESNGDTSKFREDEILAAIKKALPDVLEIISSK